MPLSGIVGAERNPKDHDIGGIATSIDEFGFNDPPTIDERTERLVAGHGRIKGLRAMKVQGEPPPERVREHGGEWYVPVIRGIEFDSKEKAEGYLLAANRWVEQGGWNQDALSDMLSDLAASDELRGVGWDAEAIDEMLKSTMPKIGERDGTPEDDERADEANPFQHQCPECGFEFN